MAYALDILAWDWFFALSMLFAVPVFKVGKLEITMQILMIFNGVMSLTGWIGVPLADMQVRNIGIIGYGVMAPVVFLLLGIVFGRTQHGPDDTEQGGDSRPEPNIEVSSTIETSLLPNLLPNLGTQHFFRN